MKSTVRNTIVSIALAGAIAAPWRVLWAQRVERLPVRIDNHNKTILRGTRNRHIEGLVSEGPRRGFNARIRDDLALPAGPMNNRLSWSGSWRSPNC
jgi:hypothetical protein